MSTLKKGDKVLCIAARDLRDLTQGHTYTVVKDEEPGIFADRPYVTVMGECNMPAAAHASRFEKVEEETNEQT